MHPKASSGKRLAGKNGVAGPDRDVEKASYSTLASGPAGAAALQGAGFSSRRESPGLSHGNFSDHCSTSADSVDADGSSSCFSSASAFAMACA